MLNGSLKVSSPENDEVVKNIVLVMIGLNDPYTKEHMIMVAEFAARIAIKLGLSLSSIEEIKLAGFLHDVGKQGIPKVILSKPQELSYQEFELVKTHVDIGVSVLKTLNVSDRVINIVAEHHERIDGSGYPRGLKGSEISLEGQIVGVADVVSALMSKRTYRTAATEKEVEEVLLSLMPDKMHPDIVNAALYCIHYDESKTCLINEYSQIMPAQRSNFF